MGIELHKLHIPEGPDTVIVLHRHEVEIIIQEVRRGEHANELGNWVSTGRIKTAQLMGYPNPTEALQNAIDQLLQRFVEVKLGQNPSFKPS